MAAPPLPPGAEPIAQAPTPPPLPSGAQAIQSAPAAPPLPHGAQAAAPEPGAGELNVGDVANKVPGVPQAQDAFADIQGRMAKSVRDPLGAAMNVEQALARGTSTLFEDLGTGHGIHSVGHALLNAINPDEGNEVVDRMTAKVQPLVEGVLSHTPILGNILSDQSVANKFFAHIGAQSIVDPVSWFPVANVAKRTLAATKIAQQIATASREYGVMIPGIKQGIKVGKQFQQNYEDHLGKQFHIHLTQRPELEEHLDFPAKTARMRIEQKHISNMEDELGVPDRALLQKNAKALKDVKPSANMGMELPEDIRQRYLQEPWRYGTPEMRQQAEELGYHPDLKGKDAHWAQMPENLLDYNLRHDYQYLGDISKKMKDSPAFASAGGKYGSDKMAAEMQRKGNFDGIEKDQNERVAARLEMGRNFVRRRRVDNETGEFLKKFGGWHGPDPIDVSKLSHSGVRIFADSPGRTLSKLGKDTILASVLPHLINNMGTLTYFKAGIPALVKSAVYMVKPPPAELVERLKNMGSHQSYAGDFSKIIGAQVPGLQQVLHFNNAILDRAETGMRAAVLEHLDKTMGASKNVADEYQKGQEIMNAMGDYRNVSALISFFQAIGAPFASFAGITSKAAKQVILSQHAYRFAQPLRVQQAMNEDPDTFHGLQIPNPALKFAKIASGSALTTNSVVGPLGGVIKGIALAESGHPFIQNLGQWAAENISQYAGPIGGAIPAMFDMPYGTPDKDPGTFDPIGGLIHGFIGDYFSVPKSSKADKYIERDVDRAGGG
jgi:hypothetical protein